MKATFLRYIVVLVYVYLAISFTPAFPSSDRLTHIATLKKDRGRAPSIAFSPDGKLIAGGSNNVAGSTTDIWRLNDLQSVHFIKGLSRDIAFSPDGSVFITTVKNAVQLWDVTTWHIMEILAAHSGEIHSVTFSHDGQILATGDYNGTIKLWDIATRRNIRTIDGHKHPDFDRDYNLVSSLEFSPDDKILASASWDNTVKLWNVDTGDEIATLNHVGSVYTVAFSPDGTMVVSGGSGGPQRRETLKVWDAGTGSNIATFDGETVKSIDFSSNGDFPLVCRPFSR